MTDKQLEAHFHIINERLNKIERLQGTFITDLEKDRGDLQDFTVEVARLGGIVDGVRKGQTRQTEKIANAVEEAATPIINEANKIKKATEGLNQTIQDKKFVLFHNKRSWKFLKFFKRG